MTETSQAADDTCEYSPYRRYIVKMEVFVDRDSEKENVAVEEDFREEELLGWIPDVDEDEEDEV